MATKWGAPQKHADGSVWQYFITKKFAFRPTYIQGALIWLAPYWITWPADQDGNVIELYRSMYPYDPGPGPK